MDLNECPICSTYREGKRLALRVGSILQSEEGE